MSIKTHFSAIPSILCPRLGAEWIGWMSWLPRAPLGPIFMTGLYSVQSIVPTYYRSGRPVINIGPKGDLGSYEIRPIHFAPSLGQSMTDIPLLVDPFDRRPWFRARYIRHLFMVPDNDSSEDYWRVDVARHFVVFCPSHAEFFIASPPSVNTSFPFANFNCFLLFILSHSSRCWDFEYFYLSLLDSSLSRCILFERSAHIQDIFVHSIIGWVFKG